MAGDLHGDSFFGRIIGGDGGYRTLRILMILFLVAGTAASGYYFKKFVDASDEPSIVIPPVPNLASKDSERLEKLIGSFRSSVDTRTRSLLLASTVVETSRMPFAETPPADMTPREVPGEGVTVAEGEGTFPPLVREKLPPIMFVRAIMVAQKQAIAVMDIEGVGNGIIVRPGYSFGGGDGKVVGISSGKVTVNWSGKNIDIAPGL